MISYANPKAQYLQHKNEIVAAISGVLDSGNYVLSEQVATFECEFSKYLDVGFTVGCGSGTDALVLALRAINVGKEDEIIVPSHTAAATVAAIVIAGATPVYVDIEPNYFTLDPAKVVAAITDKTKAIIAVHLYGQAVAMDQIVKLAEQNGLYIIEDCAQAAGAAYKGQKIGTIGDIGCFSFFPTKNLSAIGDGGAVVCNNEALATRLRSLRQYGWDKNRNCQEPGMNSRLDEMQAAILRVKLRYLDSDNGMRQTQAKIYDKALANTPINIPVKREEAQHVYHLYVVLTEKRDVLIQYLNDNGVEPGIHYQVPIHQMRAYRKKISLPTTEKYSGEVLSLPIYPGLDPDEQSVVISLIKAFYNSN